MALTDQLGPPASNSLLVGRYTLHKFVRCEASAGDATAIVWANLTNIVSITVDKPSWDYEADGYQQGGGDDKLHVRRGPKWTGKIECHAGKVFDVLALLKGLTWTTAGTAGISLRQENDYPDVIIQSIAREGDNSTHVFSRVLQDLIIDDMGVDSPMDYADREIPFHTYHEPFPICGGSQLVYHIWDATAGTPTYTSTGTPLTIITSASHDDWSFDNMIFCKLKDNSAGDAVGKRLTTGVSLAGGTLTFTTGTPAASDTVYALYVVAV